VVIRIADVRYVGTLHFEGEEIIVGGLFDLNCDEELHVLPDLLFRLKPDVR